MHYNGSSFVTSVVGTFPAQPEDGIFVTADIINPPVPEPSTYALMFAGLAAIYFTMRGRTRGRAARFNGTLSA